MVTYLGIEPIAVIVMIKLILGRSICTGSGWLWTTWSSAPPLSLIHHLKCRYNSALLTWLGKSFRHPIPNKLKWWREFANYFAFVCKNVILSCQAHEVEKLERTVAARWRGIYNMIRYCGYKINVHLRHVWFPVETESRLDIAGVKERGKGKL